MLAGPLGQPRTLGAMFARCRRVLRIAIADAIETVPGTDPDRASYQIAVEVAQNPVTDASNITEGTGDPADDIGPAVLASMGS
jgi:hypothetical protein